MCALLQLISSSVAHTDEIITTPYVCMYVCIITVVGRLCVSAGGASYVGQTTVRVSEHLVFHRETRRYHQRGEGLW